MNAKYLGDYEQIGEFDNMEWTSKVVRDKNGKIHILKIMVTVDGKILPSNTANAVQYFEQLGQPFDRNRVGMRIIDRQMPLKKALKEWLPNAIPTDLEKFLNSIGIDLIGLATR